MARLRSAREPRVGKARRRGVAGAAAFAPCGSSSRAETIAFMSACTLDKLGSARSNECEIRSSYSSYTSVVFPSKSSLVSVNTVSASVHAGMLSLPVCALAFVSRDTALRFGKNTSPLDRRSVTVAYALS
eukprot:5720744-Prymnesium_polylepis.1